MSLTGILNGWDKARDGEYPGALPIGPEAAEAARAAAAAKAAAPSDEVRESELASMLGIRERDLFPLYVSALAALNFPRPRELYELQKYPHQPKAIRFWMRYDLMQWIERYREASVTLKIR